MESDRVTFLSHFPEEAVAIYRPYLEADPETFVFDPETDAGRALLHALDTVNQANNEDKTGNSTDEDAGLVEWLAEEVVLNAYANSHLNIFDLLKDERDLR